MDEFADEFARMGLRLREEPDVDQTVERIIGYATTAVGCAHASVMLVRGGNEIERTVASAEIAAEADRLQLECGEGPCVGAIDDVTSYLVHEAATDTRWPSWGSRVAALGIHSVASVRLDTAESTIGALNHYDESPRHFDSDDLAVAEILARHASMALDSSLKQDVLRRAVDTRNVVGQAQGILMERYDLDADEAFSLLRRYAAQSGARLTAVARRLIDRQ
jgi:GAF domain-containing protein